MECFFVFSYNSEHAPVAQWIEQRTSKPKVVGSIPTRGTKTLMFKTLRTEVFFRMVEYHQTIRRIHMATDAEYELSNVDLLGLNPEIYVTDHPLTIDDEWLARITQENGRIFKRKSHEGRKFLKKDVDIITIWRNEVMKNNRFLDQDSITALVPTDELKALITIGGIYGIPDHGRTLYPTYQFDPKTKRPYPLIGDLIKHCEGYIPWEPQIFLELPLDTLDGKTVREVLYTDPEFGLEALKGLMH
jgi:hypothetical protein